MRSSRSTAQVYQRAPTERGSNVCNASSRRDARTCRAGGGRSVAPGACASRALSCSKRIGMVASGASVQTGRPSVVTSTSSSRRAVGHLQRVVGRHHERAGGERVRGDEGDDVALHSPGQHRTAVGEVVAGRARRGGDHQAVAANLAELLALHRVGELGHAPVGAPVEGDVVDGELVARRRCRSRARAAPSRRTRRRAPAATSLVELPGLDGGEEADRAEVDGEHGHAACPRTRAGG